MNQAKTRYNIINTAVLLTTALFFINDYRLTGSILREKDPIHILIFVATVFLVHAIKLGRIFFALYGSNARFADYIKVYCKVTPVSMVIPFKLGEIFRMYCYGNALGHMVRGIVIVFMDRFMDTMALVTVVLLIWALNGIHITPFVLLLLLFLLFVMLAYLVFPGVYRYWKRYFLRARATEHRLSALKMLDALERIYQEIKGVSKGKGIILYFMSLLAWGVEIGGAALQNGMAEGGGTTQKLLSYLASAMGNTPSPELREFVLISVIVLIVGYAVAEAKSVRLKRKVTE